MIRDFRTRVELRDTDGGGPPDIVGMAAPFYSPDIPGSEYRLWDGAVERIMPTAFDGAIADGNDVFATFNHDVNNLLGRRRSSTLTLEKTDEGLAYRIKGKDTPAYRELTTSIERGDVYGSSFTFSIRAGGVEWTKDDDEDVRELHSLELYELGPVVSPAYEATETGLRNKEQLQEARDSWRAWNQLRQAELESLRRTIDLAIARVLR